MQQTIALSEEMTTVKSTFIYADTFESVRIESNGDIFGFWTVSWGDVDYPQCQCICNHYSLLIVHDEDILTKGDNFYVCEKGVFVRIEEINGQRLVQIWAEKD